MPACTHLTIGFGIPADSLESHHYQVIIPRRVLDETRIREYLDSEENVIECASVDFTYWHAIAGITHARVQ